MIVAGRIKEKRLERQVVDKMARSAATSLATAFRFSEAGYTITVLSRFPPRHFLSSTVINLRDQDPFRFECLVVSSTGSTLIGR